MENSKLKKKVSSSLETNKKQSSVHHEPNANNKDREGHAQYRSRKRPKNARERRKTP